MLALTHPRAWSETRTQRLRQAALYLGFWTLVVLVYSLRVESRGREYNWAEFLKISMAQYYVWALLAPVIVVIDRSLPLRRDALLTRLVLHLPFSLVIATAYTYLNYGASLLIGASYDLSFLQGGFVATAFRSFGRSITIVYWAIAAAYIAYQYRNHLQDQQLAAVRLERLFAESRLASLRAQLQPHFLFNALDTVAAHVEKHPVRARLLLEKVGELLRMSFQHTDDPEIPLSVELAFTKRYLEIQRARVDDSFEVDVVSDPDVAQAMVPTFILQPLAEQVIQAGAARLSRLGAIQIAGTRDAEATVLSISDCRTALPAALGEDAPAVVDAEALALTRERLHHLYGENGHALRVDRCPGGGLKLELRLPLTVA